MIYWTMPRVTVQLRATTRKPHRKCQLAKVG
jgi:hypothetical protein